MKTAIAILGFVLVSMPTYGKDEVPDLFTKKKFNCVTLAEAANFYISMGEKRAIEALKDLEEDVFVGFEKGFDANERIGWVCRIIFQGEEDKPLRQPLYGGLSLPYLTMPLERWPLYPIGESNGVYFVLSEGYMLAGVAERASAYIDYCSSTGSFRKSAVSIPNRTEAATAFDDLKNSKRWGAIKWKDQRLGTSYTMSEEWVLRDIRSQAITIPEKQAEQGGAHQPATAVDSKSEGGEKPKPESEARSQ